MGIFIEMNMYSNEIDIKFTNDRNFLHDLGNFINIVMKGNAKLHFCT